MRKRIHIVAVLLAGLVAASPLPSKADEELQALVHMQDAFRRAAARVAPSVVQISVSGRRKDIPAPAAPTGPAARRWQMFRRMVQMAEGYNRRPDSAVSGVILSADGYVLTSYYNVYGNPAKIQVSLADGRKFDARLLGQDAYRDLALLKIEARDLRVAERGDSRRLEIGHWVLAVGRSQESKMHTATRGIVSALDRFEGNSLQISARTNYGNAGGAVVDIHGRLVGIVGQVSHGRRGGLNSGVGFATPLHVVDKVLGDLKQGKFIPRPKRPFLGIQGQPALGNVKGVEIVHIIQGTAAQKGGLKLRDVIVGFDGKPIAGMADLVKSIVRAGVGKKVEVEIRREGRTMKLTITLGWR